MQPKLTALALAVMIAIGTGGIAAATGAGTGTDGSADETRHRSTVDVDGYEFAISNEDDGFDASRTDALESIPTMVLNDDDAGDWIRDHVEPDTTLSLDVYGSLQRDEDSAHVRIYPKGTAEHGAARPLLAATVDTDAETVEVVGTDTEPVGSDRRLEATESIEFDVTERGRAATDDGQSAVRLGSTETGTIRTAESGDGTDASAAESGDRIAVRDPNDELTDAELETVRTRVTTDDDATERLRNRFATGGTVTLTVHGVSPSGEVHLDATAPGDHAETAVVVSGGDVSIDAATLIESDESDRFDTETTTVEAATPSDG